MPLVPFADRVRELRESKGWTQAELSARAELDPALVSRLLSGERAPHMDHLLALARALDVTVTELATGTNAEHALAEWVTRAEHDRLHGEVTRLSLELAAALTQAQGCAAQSETLQREINELTTARAGLENELGAALAQAAQARAVATERDELDREARQLRGALAKAEQVARSYKAAAEVATKQANVNYEAWNNTRQQLELVQADAERAAVRVGRAEKGQLATLALGGILGAMLAAPAKRPSRRG